MGLSRAIWNSRYWFAGVHVLFLLTLWIGFLISVLAMNSMYAYDEEFFWKLVITTFSLWYIPFFILAGIWLLVWLLLMQPQQELTRSDAADALGRAHLQNRLEALCMARGLPVPRLYLLDYACLNALAWGRRELRIYLTIEATQVFPSDELEAVLSQQLGHLHHGDNHVFPLMSLFITLGSQIVLLALVGLCWAWFNMPAALMGRMFIPTILLTCSFGLIWIAFHFYGIWFGRKRRFLADLFAIQLSQNAAALVRAFQRAKDHARMPILPEDLRTLAFLNPDPVLTPPWYRDPDQRIVQIQHVVGTAMLQKE